MKKFLLFCQKFLNYELHIYLIPIYFVLLANNQRKDQVVCKEVVFSIIVLEFFVTLIYLIVKGKSNVNYKKGCVFSVILIYILFYAFLKSTLNQITLLKGYHSFFILTALLIGAILLLVWRRGTFLKINQYLNYLFGLLIAFTTTQELLQFKNLSASEHEFTSNQLSFVRDKNHGDKSEKPDIYLLVFDSYANPKNLKRYFNFDDSDFLKELQLDSFKIPINSRSNYDETLKTMSSLMNLDYLPNDSSFTNNWNYARLKYDSYLRNNNLIRILHQNDYEFKNISIFDMEEFPTPVRDNLHYFLLVVTNTITFCTPKLH